MARRTHTAAPAAPAPPREPEPERARGEGWVPLIPVLVGVGVVAAAWPPWHTERRTVQAVAGELALFYLLANPLGRRLHERVWPRLGKRAMRTAWLSTVVAGWAEGYVLCVLLAVSPWVLCRAARVAFGSVGQPTEHVKPNGGGAAPQGERWASAASHAGLVHPEGEAAGLVLEPAGPPVPNGVGGQMVRLTVPPGVLPSDFEAAVPQLRRWLHVPHVYVRPAAGDADVVDEVEVHYYGRRPLGEPIPWRRLAPHATGDPGRVPFAFDVFADPMRLDVMQSVLFIAESRAGKGGMLTAVIAGCAFGRIPVRLRLADNRSGGDQELLSLSTAAAAYVRSPADIWLQLRERGREIQRRRDRGLTRDGRTASLSNEHPLEVLVITEAMSLLSPSESKPPAAPPDGMTWAEYTDDQFTTRPSPDDWVLMLANTIAAQNRQGASVGVTILACAQAAQLDAGGKAFAIARRTFLQNVLGKVRTGSDVDPALGTGALAAGANAHDLPKGIPGLLYVRDGFTVVHGRSAFVPPDEMPELAALLAANREG